MAMTQISTDLSGLHGSSLAHLLAGMRQAIVSGKYPAGTWLPTERELAGDFGVARRAVRRAVDILADEGLVVRRPRSRPVIAKTAPVPSLLAPAPAASDASTAPSSAGVRPDTPAGNRLVALVMWHGDPEEQGVTAQQRIFWGLNHRLAQDGYHGVFLDLGGAAETKEALHEQDLRSSTEAENIAREAACLRYVVDQGFAGVIFYAYAYRRNRSMIQEASRRVPLVLIDRLVPGIEADYVGIDNFRAQYEATQYVLSLGHRRVLFITTAESIITVQDRMEGYRQAMADAPGGALPENILTSLSQWTVPEWPLFESLFRMPPDQRPTAILCVNDHTAMNVCRRLTALGLRVPEDVSLCGFDDNCSVLPNGVPLTTVAQPFERIGRTAAETFLERQAKRADDRDFPRHVELTTRLVARASVAAFSGN